MSDPNELAELDSGLTSGFWQRFCAHVEHEWGASGATYQQAVQRAIQGPVGTEVEAIQRLKAVTLARDAIMRLLRWPDERIAMIRGHVKRESDGAGPSRRGQVL